MLILFDRRIGLQPIGLGESGRLKVVLGMEEEREEAEDDAFVVIPRAGKRFGESVIIIAAEEIQNGVVAG